MHTGAKEVGELSKSFLVANISSRLGDSSEPKPTSAACELGNTEKTQAARNLNRCSMKKGGFLIKKQVQHEEGMFFNQKAVVFN